MIIRFRRKFVVLIGPACCHFGESIILSDEESHRFLSAELDVIPRLPQGMEVDKRNVIEQKTKLLRPGDAVVDTIRVSHLGKIARKPGQTLTKVSEKRPHKLERTPDPRGFYETDPRALPPGVAGRPMVTIVHRVGDVATGGVTFLITEKENKGPRKKKG